MDRDCEKIRNIISELITENSATENAEVRRHIEQCQACSSYYQALKADDQLLRGFVEDSQIRVNRLEKKVVNVVINHSCSMEIHFFPAWRTITSSSISKWVAAIIVIGMLLAVTYFIATMGGSTTVLARTLEQMKQSSWIHSVYERHSPGGESVDEIWESFEPHIYIMKRQDGTIRYNDYGKKIEYQYNPHSNVVTILFRTGHYLLPDPNRPFETVSRIIESTGKGKAIVTMQKKIIDGVEAEVIRIVYADDPRTESIVMVRDVERNVLTRMEIKGKPAGKDGAFTLVTTFDYPENGPEDIYALGVPKEAKIVDLRPGGSAMTLVELVQRKFEEGYGDHIAVVLMSWVEDDGSLDPSSISIFRRKGDLRRTDEYHAYNFQYPEQYPFPEPNTLYEKIKDVWPNVTIPQILKLLDDGAIYRQILFDGKQTITQSNDNNEREWKRYIMRANIFLLNPEDCLAGLAWTCPYRQITSGSSHMKQDIHLLAEDPNHPGLVGFQLLKFAQTEEYWFDPNKDYIRIEYTRRQSGNSSFVKTSVTRTDRTTDGRWYPVVIRTDDASQNAQGQTRILRLEKRILLDMSPSFEENVFNASSLKK